MHLATIISDLATNLYCPSYIAQGFTVTTDTRFPKVLMTKMGNSTYLENLCLSFAIISFNS